jgi:acyl transferase domain-containing protein
MLITKSNPDMHAGLSRGHFLSPTGNCKTFDDGADGYCRGEAVVTIILKRLGDAQIDQDPVQACIRAIATNHSAEAESITRPHVGAQQELFEHLLTTTGLRAQDISYVEMHGTGTQAGDAGETTSVVETLAGLTSQGLPVRPTTHPLHIGAAKSNVGHGEAAAGVTSLAKVLLMLKHSTIPPHCGIKTKLNHRLPDLQARNTFISRKGTAWQRPINGKRTVLLNNFSAAGGNTALILEDAPEVEGFRQQDSRKYHIVAVSAKTPPSLTENIRNLIAWIDAQDAADTLLLPRLSYTTTARRIHLRHRVAVTGSSLAHIRSALQDHLRRRENGDNGALVPVKGPEYVFAFTGQGSPFAGMGADLYSHFGAFRSDIQRYDELCKQMGFPSIRSMFESTKTFDTATPTVLQLTHVCFQMALARLWSSFGLTPKAVVGHSLGEYAALYTSGALSQADVINLVGRRAQLMEQHLTPGTHAMLVAFTNEECVAQVLASAGKRYEISCRNGFDNIVLGGTSEEMEEARILLEADGVRCIPLNTPYAFHTSQVDAILDYFTPVASGAEIGVPQTPVISPTYGDVLRSSWDFSNDYFVQHCRRPVDMVRSLTAAKEQGLINDSVIAIEIGPAPIVSSVVKEVAGSAAMHTFASIRKGRDTWELLTQALSKMYSLGATIDWSRYHSDFAGCQQVLELPAYSWSLKNYCGTDLSTCLRPVS